MHTSRRSVGVGSKMTQGRKSRAPRTEAGVGSFRTTAQVRGAGVAAVASAGWSKGRPIAVLTLGAASAAGLGARERATETRAPRAARERAQEIAATVIGCAVELYVWSAARDRSAVFWVHSAPMRDTGVEARFSCTCKARREDAGTARPKNKRRCPFSVILKNLPSVPESAV
jgi:hypothetical protein